MMLRNTDSSPYGRLSRIVLKQKSPEGRVLFKVAQKRDLDNSYFKLILSGRVPLLMLDNNLCIKDARLMC